MRKYTKTMMEREFSTDDVCLDYLFNSRWPKGPECKKCRAVTKHFRIKNRKSYSCQFCGSMISPTANTIFHKSELPLRSWFYAIFLMASTRTGVASMQLERELGVNHRTALRMFRQIRSLMANDSGSLMGDVEVDETYIGGRRKGKRGRGAAGKTIVAGAVERGGDAVMTVVPNVKGNTLLPFIQANVDPSATVYTDELRSYDRLAKSGYAHETVNHGAGQYVDGMAHVNTMESLWSNAKRGIDGVNHHVSPRYLQTYLDAYTFRYSHRDDETPMFQTLLHRASRPLS